MIIRRLTIAGAAAALAAGPLTAPVHAAAPTGTTVATRATSVGAGSAERRKKKWVLSYTIAPFQGTAFDYTWRLTTKSGRPVRGAKVYQQYHAVPYKWSSEGVSYRTDANGEFHVYSCNESMGRERMYVKPTKKRAAVARVYQLRQCGS